VVGVDIVAISRMCDFVARFGRLALERFLSSNEIALCVKGGRQDAIIKCAKMDRDTFVDSINIARVAGFWAAKEALSKALGVGIGTELGFLDMCIYKNDKNQPHIMLVDKKMQEFNIKHIALSISHDSHNAISAKPLSSGGFAIAVVVIDYYE